VGDDDRLGRGLRARTAVSGDPLDPRGFPVAVAAFCDSLLARHYSERTVDGREEHLAHLAGWLAERGVQRPAEVTRPLLQRYQRWLFWYRTEQGRPLSLRRQYERLVAVRLFFGFLARQNRILYNPAADLELPRLTRRLPRWVLTPSEVERVLQQPDLSDPIGVRDRALLETLYATGVRRVELAGLSLYDLDAERGTLLVRHGKGRKDRVVPIGERAVRWIEKYLAEVRPLLIVEPDEGTMFLGNGEAIGLHRLTELVRDYVDASSIGKRGSCHLFRHSMATAMLEGGADVRYVQEMLGHALLETTQLYTKVSIRQLQRVYAASHPAAHAAHRLLDDDDEGRDDEAAEQLLLSLAAQGEDGAQSTNGVLPETPSPARFVHLRTVRRQRLPANSAASGP
jgi:integrase/recombinase XerD